MKQLIKGVIKDATQVQQFEKKNGEINVKCVLHIVAIDDDPHPEEVAVTVCGNLTLYSKAVGSPVAVEYIVRVFSFGFGLDSDSDSYWIGLDYGDICLHLLASACK